MCVCVVCVCEGELLCHTVLFRHNLRNPTNILSHWKFVANNLPNTRITEIFGTRTPLCVIQRTVLSEYVFTVLHGSYEALKIIHQNIYTQSSSKMRRKSVDSSNLARSICTSSVNLRYLQFFFILCCITEA